MAEHIDLLANLGHMHLTLGTLQRVTDALGLSLTLGVGSHEVAIPAA